MTAFAPGLRHVRALTDAGGLYEHAEGTRARPAHGYCVDDVARGLVVVVRVAAHAPVDADLREQYLAFLLLAQVEDGRFHNRRDTELRWTDAPTDDDCWGRALWGLGTLVASTEDPLLRGPALQAFERGAARTSRWPRANAFAALGAAEVLGVLPHSAPARDLLVRVLARAERPGPDPAWPWPEPALSYANPVLAEVLLAAGACLGDDTAVADGLLLLRWLLAAQTRAGHLSLVPVGGRRPGEPDLARFDQQPIEVAALADACARAHRLTGDPLWAGAVRQCAAWFHGDNDAGTVMLDAVSGGGYDGLEPGGRNENQGAESTLAMLSTLERAARLGPR